MIVSLVVSLPHANNFISFVNGGVHFDTPRPCFGDSVFKISNVPHLISRINDTENLNCKLYIWRICEHKLCLDNGGAMCSS